MPDLEDGQQVQVRGSTGSTYTLERKGDVRSCSCPAWRNQSAAIADRTCKHLRAYLGEAAERERTGSAAAVARIAPRPSWVPKHREDPEIRARRRAALTAAVECFPVAYDKMMLAYGLRMPRHLAYAMGFWNGLSRDERSEAWGYLGTGPCGVGELFEEGGLEREVAPGLDARLHYRFRCDPPEMVSVFGGNSDGSHWGLWYDDPAELPRAICHNWSRDSAETSAEEPTLLATFRASLYGPHSEPLDAGYTHAGAILDWLDEVHAQELAAYREEAIAPLPARASTLGGLGPWVPGWSPPSDLPDEYARHTQYREDPASLAAWIARARQELQDRKPGLALVIGRDLHWLDKDEHRITCTELLVDGYRMLGRDAIADIVRVHHLHRDLGSVDVYAQRELTPFEKALGAGDVDAVAAYLEGSSEPQRLVKEMHVHAPMLDVLLPHASAQVVEDAQLFHLEQLHFWRPQPDQPDYAEHRLPHRTTALALFDRKGVNARVLEAALRSADADIAARALATVDLAWRSERGRSVLHMLCRWGNVDGVRALLDRGADGKLVDADGETPYDAVKHAWVDHRDAAAQLYDLLRERGFGPPPKVATPPAGTWEAGTRVNHAKFGAGVVKAATGRGDDAKLTIAFPDGTKTLLGKFVKRDG